MRSKDAGKFNKFSGCFVTNILHLKISNTKREISPDLLNAVIIHYFLFDYNIRSE